MLSTVSSITYGSFSFCCRMYHDERIFREDDRGHTETTQVSIPKDVCLFLPSRWARFDDSMYFFFFSPIKFPVGRCDYRQGRRSDPQDPWRLWCEHHDRRAPSGFHWTDHHHFRLVASDMESAISASAEVNQPSVVESCAVPSGEKIKKEKRKTSDRLPPPAVVVWKTSDFVVRH